MSDDLPAEMSRTRRDCRTNDPIPRALLVVLLMLVVLGIAGTLASVQSARQSGAASRADVQRAQALTEALAQAQRISEQRTYETRQDNRILLQAICAQVEAVVQRVPALHGVPPCPRLSPVPQPAPAAVPPTEGNP